MKLALLDENHAEAAARVGPSDDKHRERERVRDEDPKLHALDSPGARMQLTDTPGMGTPGAAITVG